MVVSKNVVINFPEGGPVGAFVLDIVDGHEISPRRVHYMSIGHSLEVEAGSSVLERPASSVDTNLWIRLTLVG